MKILCCSILILLPIVATVVRPGQTEQVKIDYELLLNKCKGDSCHSETAARGEAYVSLEAEDPSFSWGYTPMEEHAGSLVYQLRFDLSRVSKGNKVERKLAIGFSGRVGALTGKQLTWSEKEFSGKDWGAFRMKSTSGIAYSEGEETITPTLKVLQVATFP
jgi:hypothetical protein